VDIQYFLTPSFRLLKAHLNPKRFFAKSNLLVIRSIWTWISLNPRFSMPFKVALEVLHDRVWGSLGLRLLMTSTQEPNAMAPQSTLYICSRKRKAKLFVTGVRVKFRFERLRNKLRSSEHVRQLWTYCLELWEQFAIFQATTGRTSFVGELFLLYGGECFTGN